MRNELCEMRDQNKRVFRAKTAGRELLLSVPVRLYDTPYLLVPSSRIVLFVLVVIPVVESLLPIVDALSLYDLSGAGLSCGNPLQVEIFPK